jgi:hypothetical protein
VTCALCLATHFAPLTSHATLRALDSSISHPLPPPQLSSQPPPPSPYQDVRFTTAPNTPTPTFTTEFQSHLLQVTSCSTHPNTSPPPPPPKHCTKPLQNIQRRVVELPAHSPPPPLHLPRLGGGGGGISSAREMGGGGGANWAGKEGRGRGRGRGMAATPGGTTAHRLRRGSKLEPQNRSRKPQTTNHKPQTTNHKPQTTNHKPQTTNHKPQTTNHKPQTTNHKPHTTNVKHTTAYVCCRYTPHWPEDEVQRQLEQVTRDV